MRCFVGQVLSVYLPQWEVELVRRRSRATRQSLAGKSLKPRHLPLMLIGETARQERVVRCCPAASAAGVFPGMSVAEAKALCPAARVMPFEPDSSRNAFDPLAQWAMRFSPMVMVDPTAVGGATGGTGPAANFATAEGLLLEVTGVAHLFGGEQLMLAELVTRLYRMGFSARVAIAPTIGAAWALSRYGRAPLSIVAEEHVAVALSPLPVPALRLPVETCKGLADIGI